MLDVLRFKQQDLIRSNNNLTDKKTLKKDIKNYKQDANYFSLM